MRYYLAIDIGASSGRHILGHMDGSTMVLEEVYRFENRQLRRGGHDCWDLDNLKSGILEGLRACAAAGKIPETVGIDTWGVDFVLLDADGALIGDAVAYRDSRTTGMREVVDAIIPARELYARTGIQYQPFNTIYQLTALQREHPEQLEAADRLLLMPEYLSYLLCGVKQSEYTIASTGALVSAEEKQWDRELIGLLGLPQHIFGPLAMPGTRLGPLRPEIREAVGFDTTVILPATHDTGSAYLAVPARDDNAAFLSSGTWSLLGVENDRPFTSPACMEKNFTNEGGAWGRYRFLQNIMGLWMIQSIRRELNGISYIQGKDRSAASQRPSGLAGGQRKWSFPELAEEAKKAEGFSAVVDVNRERFLAPESMIDAICAECAETGQPVPATVGELMQCVYTSLALCYRDAILGLQELTGKTFTAVNIVGGGCQDNYLNLRTAQATGLPVYAGPVEGTAIGNLLVQMISGGDLTNLQAARDAIRRSFEVREVTP